MTDRDRTTLTDAFVASRAALTRYIATFFAQREDIEDTLQQAYTEALTSVTEKGVAIESPKAYLFRVARNIALNKKKRQQIVFIENVGIVDDSIVSNWQEASDEAMQDLDDDIRRNVENVVLNYFPGMWLYGY